MSVHHTLNQHRTYQLKVASVNLKVDSLEHSVDTKASTISSDYPHFSHEYPLSAEAISKLSH